MTRESAITVLKICQESADPETAHMVADAILTTLLAALGYDDVVKEWEKVDKRYD